MNETQTVPTAVRTPSLLPAHSPEGRGGGAALLIHSLFLSCQTSYRVLSQKYLSKSYALSLSHTATRLLSHSLSNLFYQTYLLLHNHLTNWYPFRSQTLRQFFLKRLSNMYPILFLNISQLPSSFSNTSQKLTQFFLIYLLNKNTVHSQTHFSYYGLSQTFLLLRCFSNISQFFVFSNISHT